MNDATKGPNNTKSKQTLQMTKVGFERLGIACVNFFKGCLSVIILVEEEGVKRRKKRRGGVVEKPPFIHGILNSHFILQLQPEY